jgi:hypothetical protein
VQTFCVRHYFFCRSLNNRNIDRTKKNLTYTNDAQLWCGALLRRDWFPGTKCIYIYIGVLFLLCAASKSMWKCGKFCSFFRYLMTMLLLLLTLHISRQHKVFNEKLFMCFSHQFFFFLASKPVLSMSFSFVPRCVIFTLCPLSALGVAYSPECG